MSIQSTTWGHVETGTVVRDKKDHLWIVGPADDGRLLLTPAHGRGDPILATRPPSDREVDIYVATEAEALALLHEELGARHLRDIEEREHTIARALNWRVDPVRRNLTALRDHISWLHGFNVDDVWRKGTGTDVNPVDAKGKRASVDELCRAHDEAHADPETWPHSRPHHHAQIGAS